MEKVSMELHLDVDGGVAEYIEESGLADQLSSFLSQVYQLSSFLSQVYQLSSFLSQVYQLSSSLSQVYHCHPSSPRYTTVILPLPGTSYHPSSSR